ncbi:MAG: 30S ribosomal protein S2, partial [Nanoarchaeota archaeon]|nr:30S ribosomal protein S2 [Nanoarchaeota archaeon]
REAKRVKIPIVAIVDTNDNPTEVDFPIVANDHARASINWVIEKIVQALQEVKTEEVKEHPTE